MVSHLHLFPLLLFIQKWSWDIYKGRYNLREGGVSGEDYTFDLFQNVVVNCIYIDICRSLYYKYSYCNIYL